MPSVVGLLESRERAARQRVEVLQAEHREAEEAAWEERFVIARQSGRFSQSRLPTSRRVLPYGTETNA